MFVDCAPFRKQPEERSCVIMLWYNENKIFSICQALTIKGQPTRWTLKKLRVACYEKPYSSHFHLQCFAFAITVSDVFTGASR